MKLEDLKVIVTGGAQGMGRTFALALVEAGASVVICDVNEAGLTETKEAAAGKRGKLFAKKTNVADEAENAALVDFDEEAAFRNVNTRDELAEAARDLPAAAAGAPRG